MLSASRLRSQIEARIPAAFACSKRLERATIATGIAQIDELTGGIPIGALTEICGTKELSSGKTSVLGSVLAQASQNHFCALVDASDTFHPAYAQATGINFSRLLWIRCGKNQSRLKPLEQAFKAADILVQSGGFGLIAVDLGDIPERFVRNVPMASWFRFSRVVEKQSIALVFIEQQAHAASCAGLVLEIKNGTASFAGKLITGFNFQAEILRNKEKKPSQSAGKNFALKALWA